MTNFPLDKITPSVNNFVAFVVRKIKKKKRMIVVSTSTDGKTHDFSVHSIEVVVLLFFLSCL